MIPRNRFAVITALTILFSLLVFSSIILPRFKKCFGKKELTYKKFREKYPKYEDSFVGYKYPPNVARSTNIDWNTVSVTDLDGPQIIDYFLWTNQSSCLLSHDFGGQMFFTPSGLDGQKAVCLDPVRVAPKPGNCIVYSFGINDDWSFDEAMERYGCEVFAFDPSMDDPDHDHSESIHFYKLGLGRHNGTDVDNNWPLMTLAGIYQKLSWAHKTNKYIDYLKMDIELDEWGVLLDMLNTDMLSKVRQLAVEFHLLEDEGLALYRKFAKVLQLIERKGNMVRFDSKYNPWFMGQLKGYDMTCSFGYEIAWYNGKL